MMSLETPPSKLIYFPISLFACVMGLSGLALDSFSLSFDEVGVFLSFISLIVFLLIAGFYGLKAIKHREAVIQEWKNPVKISFFCAGTISLLLLSGAFLPINLTVSALLWWTGTIGQFLISMATINYWIKQTHYEVAQMTPTWFIPAVGNIIVPVAGLHHAPIEFSWFFFAWGLLFWGILVVMLFQRLVFKAPLPEKLIPSLFIMLAPPSIGFVSYMNIVQELDTLGTLMYFWAGFFFLLLVSQFRQFTKLKFSLVWWAYSFPMTAFCAATTIMGEITGKIFFIHGALGLYAITCVIIAFLSFRTIVALAKGQILKPE